MRKGFTLLELIVVVIIIGILATLGFTQYQRMIERSRGAEARSILGDIRKYAAAFHMEFGSLTPAGHAAFSPADANIGAQANQVPGTAAGNCRPSHYFYYNTANQSANIVLVTATRCGPGTSKADPPAGAAGTTLTLQSDLSTGQDTWGGAGNY